MARYEQIRVGDKAEISHTLTRRDIDRFVELTGDDNRLHVDAAYSAETPFKKPVAHGMLGASFISTLIGTRLPGDGALWYAQSLEFLLPARVGDRITVKAEVLKKIDRMRALELKTDIYNQNGQKITAGFAKVKVIEPRRAERKGGSRPAIKAALVLGATGGIGRAACLELAKEGFDVAVHCHSNEKLARQVADQVVKLGRKALIVKGDLLNEDDIAALVETAARRLGGLTALVNCASIALPLIPFAELTWKEIQSQWDAHVRPAWTAVRAAIPYMESAGGGSIVHLTSQSTESAPPQEFLHYVTAKSALNGMSKALAVELASKKIRVNLVSPGMTDTDMIADFPEKARLLTEARTPLRRLAQPRDVAQAIAYLASDRSEFVTGETLRVNGGQVML